MGVGGVPSSKRWTAPSQHHKGNDYRQNREVEAEKEVEWSKIFNWMQFSNL